MNSAYASFNPLRFVKPATGIKPREVLIAEIAYFRAQSRGFQPGHELEDWIAAEHEIREPQAPRDRM
jgi:hypothetical protein